MKSQRKPSPEGDESIPIRQNWSEEILPDLEPASDDKSVLSLVDEGEILQKKDDKSLEILLEESQETRTLRRSSRARVPIKRLMDEQVLYQEPIGTRSNGSHPKPVK